MTALIDVSEAGVKVAPGFPVGRFANLMQVVGRVRDDLNRGSAARAFVAVAFRHRTCVEESAAFEEALAVVGEDAYLFDRALFGFLTAGLAALESAAFGCHALGRQVTPLAFPMETDKDERSISIRTAARRFECEFGSCGLAQTLRDLAADSGLAEWEQIRNYVSHRQVPGRNITVVIGGRRYPTPGGASAR